MEFYNVVNSRRTIRDFQNVPIDDEVIKKIITTGMKAPTNDHMRDWHFIVIKDKDVSSRLFSIIPMKCTEEDVNGILKDWNLTDSCQQSAYKNAIPKQYQIYAR